MVSGWGEPCWHPKFCPPVSCTHKPCTLVPSTPSPHTPTFSTVYPCNTASPNREPLCTAAPDPALMVCTPVICTPTPQILHPKIPRPLPSFALPRTAPLGSAPPAFSPPPRHLDPSPARRCWSFSGRGGRFFLFRLARAGRRWLKGPFPDPLPCSRTRPPPVPARTPQCPPPVPVLSTPTSAALIIAQPAQHPDTPAQHPLFPHRTAPQPSPRRLPVTSPASPEFPPGFGLSAASSGCLVALGAVPCCFRFPFPARGLCQGVWAGGHPDRGV